MNRIKTLTFAAILIAGFAAPALAQQPMLGEPAPPIKLPTVRGDSLDLNSLRGKYIIMHFGASW
ncbi:MAG TPA: hypothetical protein VLB27_00295 [candidate division Zixibacteria bacterium]|nr:hypothetical protein [candidate division Zixibacteria bacterium]